MNRTTKMRLAAACAAAVVGSSAFGATMMANNSNKGSLLVFPRIDVRNGPSPDNPTGATWDTIITITNDSSANVQVKCYYRSSEPLPTPLSSKVDVSQIKHTMDFTFALTRNQTVAWSAATGLDVDGAKMTAPAFTGFPDGSSRPTGELKCFAIGTDAAGNVGQINFNQLLGTAEIVNTNAQAWAYNAWAFQALGGTAAQGQLVGTPGTLMLDGTITGYDMCPNILVAPFYPGGQPPVIVPPAFPVVVPQTSVSIAGCNQDLTQRATPVITKYTYTFWNQDESSRTGTHECADSWYETYLPATAITTGVGASNVGGSIQAMPLAQYASLGTAKAYMRVESVADPAVCFGSVHVGMLGVISHDSADAWLRGMNMIGRGTQPGVMTYDPGPADSFKR